MLSISRNKQVRDTHPFFGLAWVEECVDLHRDKDQNNERAERGGRLLEMRGPRRSREDDCQQPVEDHHVQNAHRGVDRGPEEEIEVVAEEFQVFDVELHKVRFGSVAVAGH